MSCWPAVVPLLTTRCLYWGSRVGQQGRCRGHWGHWGVTYEKWQIVYCKVLLNTQGGLLQTIEHELRSMGPKLVLLLATWSLYLGALRGIGVMGVYLTKHQSEPQADYMSCWPAVVPFLTTTCLYWGGGVKGANGGIGCYIWKMQMIYSKYS